MNNQLESGSNNGGGQVECLGLLFPNDDARREHFLKELAEKLKEPAFRNQEGFPLGSDDAILAMSDPPYYTACPNPWLEDFIRLNGTPYIPDEEYSREPMAINVTAGKRDLIYTAHSYHTKVPHMAIVPSILHYTEPDQIVLDGFAGSGMTGVAAQWCGLDSASFRFKLEDERKKADLPLPQWGARRTILSDLSPSATFISANYNLSFDVAEFSRSGNDLLAEVESEIGWMYETLHKDGESYGRIEFVVWSECFACHSCGGEVVFADVAIDKFSNQITKQLTCPHCGVMTKKENMELLFENYLDLESKQVNQRPKRVVYQIHYIFDGKKYTKNPDSHDYKILNKISSMPLPSDLPLSVLGDSQMTRVGRMKTTNTTSVHHMFQPRAAQAMGLLWKKANQHENPSTRSMLVFMVEQAIWGLSILNRHHVIGKANVNQWLNGVFYIPSLHEETAFWRILEGKLERMIAAFSVGYFQHGSTMISTASTGSLQIPDNSIDYIFTDPPFGENIYYSDLNFLVESWHNVTTNSKPEAIIDRVKLKKLSDYRNLMQKCFMEYHRVLKPGRWMTVVFSNSRASVWNAIQVALQQSGFVVAEVTSLNKVQGSFQQIVSPNTVKQDLVISAYKPNGGLEDRLIKRGAVTDSVWDFVETHLSNLAVTKSWDNILEIVVERDPRRIFDRMVAWFVRHDLPVPLSSGEFLGDLRKRYYERDGMIFLSGQVEEYDRKRAQSIQAPQIELFVSDERSAIDWLMDFLRNRPSTYQEVHPAFMVQIGAGWRKHEKKPELLELLKDNFLLYEDDSDVPSQIHSYLSTNFSYLRGKEKNDIALKLKAKNRWYVPDPKKIKDLDMRRERALLKEFEIYKNSTVSQLRESRLEVLRAGFKFSWSINDYNTIINISEKLPEETLQEDEQLLLWYDQSLTRTEGDA